MSWNEQRRLSSGVIVVVGGETLMIGTPATPDTLPFTSTRAGPLFPYLCNKYMSQHKKKSLSIRLLESALYLRTDGSGRRSRRNADTRSSMLRGLLVLELIKPTKISSIEIELIATAFNAWPEGISARRVEVNEEIKAFHASTVYFRANQSLPSTRRTASIGPGVPLTSVEHDQYWDVVDDEEMEDPLPGSRRDESHATTTPGTDLNTQLMPSLLRNRRVSVDSHVFQRNHISHHEDQNEIPIPPYSPVDPNSLANVSSPLSLGDHSFVHLLPIRDDRSPSLEHDPAQDLEEFRASLNSGFKNLPRSTSTPSVHSNFDRSLSRVPSTGMDNVPEDEMYLPTDQRTRSEAGPSQAQRSSEASSASLSISGLGESVTHPNHSVDMTPIRPTRGSSTEEYSRPPASRVVTSRNREGGRSASRFTLSSMADALKDAVRSTSTSRTARLILSSTERDPGRSDDPYRSQGETRDRSSSRIPRGRTMDRRVLAPGTEDNVPCLTSLPGDLAPSPSPANNASTGPKSRPRQSLEIGRIFGSAFDHEFKEKQRKEAAESHGWKEFKRGTYTYPISFSVPSTAPPTLQADYGSVVWKLNATVHRPGAFKQKLAVSREVLVIACPTEEDTEDTENVIVERDWDDQLHYLISISGKSFYIGGAVPVMFALIPLAKIKIYRILVYIEERVDYYTHMHHIARSDPATRFELLTLKHEGGRDAPHILPLDSDHVDVLRNSPLYSIINPEEDESEVASSLMGTGPWNFNSNLKLPNSCLNMRFTNKNRRANITVTHTLKVVMRVERGDDLYVDKSGKRKLFDIVVQTPVQILPCRCNPEWASLPRYSENFNDDTPIVPSCPCQVRQQQEQHHNGLNNFLHQMRLPHHHSSESSRLDDRNQEPGPSAERRPVSVALPSDSPPTNQHHNDLSAVQTNQQFARLVAGFESEFGEPPPAYTQPEAPVL